MTRVLNGASYRKFIYVLTTFPSSRHGFVVPNLGPLFGPDLEVARLSLVLPGVMAPVSIGSEEPAAWRLPAEVLTLEHCVYLSGTVSREVTPVEIHVAFKAICVNCFFEMLFPVHSSRVLVSLYSPSFFLRFGLA